jgi:hypothetical protein
MLIEQWLYSFPRRLRCFFHPNQVDEQMKDELQERLEQQIKKNPERGMSAEEARRSAVIALGGVTQIEQQCRDAPGGSILEDFSQDLRYGFRQLHRNPGFSVLAVLCLTLGIGANAAVFSWVEGILFRPYRSHFSTSRCVRISRSAPSSIFAPVFPCRSSRLSLFAKCTASIETLHFTT